MAGMQAGDYIYEFNNIVPLSKEHLIALLKMSDGIVTLKTWHLNYTEYIEYESPSYTLSDNRSSSTPSTRTPVLQHARRTYSRVLRNLANRTTVP